jgi:uncharacterized protein YeaO (DUF488 family)
MLARYKIHRGKLPPGVKLPEGVRQDTRKHTRHCLRPPAETVAAFLDNPTDAAWKKFEREYQAEIKERYKSDPAPFDDLAALASEQDVYLGCSCPTANNPDVNHCHTVLALRFMQRKYPQLVVQFPS